MTCRSYLSQESRRQKWDASNLLTGSRYNQDSKQKPRLFKYDRKPNCRTRSGAHNKVRSLRFQRVHEVNPDSQFYLFTAYFGNRTVKLPRNTVVSRVLPGPATPLIPQKANEDAFHIFIDDPNPTKIYPKNKRGIRLLPVTGIRNTPETRGLDLGAVHEIFHSDIRRMLTKHRELWNGKLGEINNTMHRIELIPDARPV